jgi:hypothetical protein
MVSKIIGTALLVGCWVSSTLTALVLIVIILDLTGLVI